MPKFALYSVTSLTLPRSVLLARTRGRSVSRFNAVIATTERKLVATPPMPLPLPRASPPTVSRDPVRSPLALARHRRPLCSPVTSPAGAALHPFLPAKPLPLFLCRETLDARPSHRRVSLRRPEHHSVAKSARAFLPARTGIIHISQNHIIRERRKE